MERDPAVCGEESATSLRRPSLSRQAARTIVCILLDQPLPGFLPRQALHAGPGTPGEPEGLAQMPVPLSYQELQKRLIWDGTVDPSPTGRRRHEPPALLGFLLSRSRENRSPRPARLAEPQRAISMESWVSSPPVSRPRRPGRGGRQPRQSPFTPTTAIQGLKDGMGTPVIDERRDGVGLHYWRLAGPGRGVAVGRLSSQEIAKGEAVLNQIVAVRHLCTQLRLQLGHIIVSTDNSGDRRFERRPDLMLLDELIRAGEVDFLCARSTDRLSRNDLSRATLEDLLKTSQTALYLCSLQRQVNWSQDKFIWRTESLLAEAERENIVRRTQGGIVASRIAEGRGRPGAVPFGFYYDPMLCEVRVDPDQWPFVVAIHEGYARLQAEGASGGLRKLSEELAAAGCPLSPSHIRNILRDPRYVTGEYTVRWGEHRVSATPIQLADPIPLELFQRNQERLALNKGKNSVTPIGLFALNAVRVLHEPCQHTQVQHRADRPAKQPLLRGRLSSKGGRSYTHYPRSPECCLGYSIPQTVLEPPILRALLQLAANRELQEEWRRAPRGTSAPSPQMHNEARRRQLIRDITEVQERIAALEARWVHEGGSERGISEREYLTLHEPLQGQLDRLTRQLDLDGRLVPRKALTTLEPAMNDIATAVDLEAGDTYAELLERLQEVLTEEPPDDPALLQKRAAVVAASLSSVLVRDTPEGGFLLELRGPLVPPGFKAIGPIGPVADAYHALSDRDNDAVDTQGQGDSGKRSGARPERIELCSTRSCPAQFDPPDAVIPFEEVSALFWGSYGEALTPSSRRRRTQTALLPRPDWTPVWVSGPLSIDPAPLPGPPTWRGLPLLEAARAAAEVLSAEHAGPCAMSREEFDRIRLERPDLELPLFWRVDQARGRAGVSWSLLAAEAAAGRRDLQRLMRFCVDLPMLARAQRAIRRGLLEGVVCNHRFYTCQEWWDASPLGGGPAGSAAGGRADSVSAGRPS